LHGYNEEDTELVAWLVEQHLLMSVTAQKRDIYDPEVIREFANKVSTKRRLQHLYCLTVADIRATNASLWNNWKATLLEELYRATDATLSNDGESKATLRERVQANKQNALGLLLSAGFSLEEVQQLWSRFTADYFSRHTPEQIAWHSQHLIHVKERQLPLILIGDENNQGTTEIFIYHFEENHLFANVTAERRLRNGYLHCVIARWFSYYRSSTHCRSTTTFTRRTAQKAHASKSSSPIVSAHEELYGKNQSQLFTAKRTTTNPL